MKRVSRRQREGVVPATTVGSRQIHVKTPGKESWVHKLGLIENLHETTRLFNFSMPSSNLPESLVR